MGTTPHPPADCHDSAPSPDLRERETRRERDIAEILVMTGLATRERSE
jgi:hypothetical protein